MATPSRTPETIADPLLLDTPAPLGEDSPLVAIASAAEDAIFGADDITDPTVPLRLQDALKTAQDAPESTHGLPLDSQDVPGVVFSREPHLGAPGRFGEHEAILQAFCTHLLSRFDTAVGASLKELNKPVDEIYGFVHQQLQIQREKAQQAETFLDTLTSKAVHEGIQLRHDPYSVKVQTLSPQGFPITLEIL